MSEGKHRRQIHLGVHLPATAWADPESLIDLARTAERGCFDFLVTDHGLPVSSALAGVTERLGLVGAIDTTSHEPFEVARQLATLDHLSDGRAGWSIGPAADVTESRAEEFVAVTRAFWDSWDVDAILADDAGGVYVDPDRVHPVEHRGTHFDVRGLATLPCGPRGHPILLQTGDFGDGARYADVVVTSHADLEAGRQRYADVRARAAVHGRHPNRVKVFSVLADASGDPERLAAALELHVRSDACDGFIVTSDALGDVVDSVVPLLRERGVFRESYQGTTLRDHLGLG